MTVQVHGSIAWTLGALLALTQLTEPARAQALLINEFVASNHGGLADEDGDTPDWIELHNPGTEPVALTGWGLSDDEDEPRRWLFEEGEIAPGGFHAVFASGKDRQHPDAPHTNFSISAAGEPLLLTDPEGEVVDHVAEHHLPVNVSLGRKPDGAPEWFYFDQPTPGAANDTESFLGVLPPPILSRESGFYADPIDLTLHHPSEGARVHYTLDGSEPHADSPLHHASIEINDRTPEPNGISMIPTNPGVPTDPATDRIIRWNPPIGQVPKATVVRARAFKEGYITSPPATATYWVGADYDTQYDLPVFSISTNPDNLFDFDTGIYVPGKHYDPNAPIQFPDRTGNYFQRGIEWERPAHMEFFEPNLQKGFAEEIGIRIHGGITRRFPIKSIRTYFRSRYGESELEYPLLPDIETRTFRRFILRNHGNDPYLPIPLETPGMKV